MFPAFPGHPQPAMLRIWQEAHFGCQAGTESCDAASDHSYVMTNNQVTSDNRHENSMRNLFPGSVSRATVLPCPTLVAISIFI